MLVSGALLLGFQTLVLPLFVYLLLSWVRKKWDESAERKEEIRRLIETVSREAELVENESLQEYGYLSPSSTNSFGHSQQQHYQQSQQHAPESDQKQEQPRRGRCAVCMSPTTTRCARCKSVHYCSGRCQITHWKGGHRDECRLFTKLTLDCDIGSQESTQKSDTCIGKRILPGLPSASDGLYSINCEEVLSSFSDDHQSGKNASREHSNEVQKSSSFPEKFDKVVRKNGNSPSIKGKLVETLNSENNGSQCDEDLMHNDAHNAALIGKSSSKTRLAEKLFEEPSVERNSSTLTGVNLDLRDAILDSGKRMTKGKGSRSLSYDFSSEHPKDACKSSKQSLTCKVKHLSAPKRSFKQKMIFPYEIFVELYSYCDELHPFGLINYGNSCYANAVLQCLAFTRPLTAYLMRGLHSAECQMKEWCFVCELENLVLKGRGGESPLSPFQILSKVDKFGSRIGRGTEEDAHEFLRYAVDTMQSIFLREAGALGSLLEETTLIGLTFGGYLRSKITCMRCHWESDRLERIMDLIVEVDGSIQTLDDAFKQFTMEEFLDGANKYHCNRCQCYVKARKDLSILEAPNVLTVVLKRFQHGNLQKLYKAVRFPEVFDIAPYTRGNRDRSQHYSLYAVVVHQSNRNDTSTGHYLCYVKNAGGVWFGINDSSVISVEPEKVLLEEAYMLLYARQRPRGPPSLAKESSSSSLGVKKHKVDAIPPPSMWNILSWSDSKAQHKHANNTYQSISKEVSGRRLRDWRFCRMPRSQPVDASSESSSMFGSSDASTCSSTATKDSDKSEDPTDFLFGGGCRQLGYDTVPFSCNDDYEALRKKDTWRSPSCWE